MNRVLMSNQQRRARMPKRRLEKLIRAVLDDQGVRAAEVSLTLVDDGAMRALNRRYRGKNRSTDVLAFRAGEACRGAARPRPLGDVVVSVETARRQAQRRGIAWHEELCRYLIHGVLHLLGHEDITRRGFARQWQLQEELLKRYASPLFGSKF